MAKVGRRRTNSSKVFLEITRAEHDRFLSVAVCQQVPPNTTHCAGVGLMLDQRRRRWHNIQPTPARVCQQGRTRVFDDTHSGVLRKYLEESIPAQCQVIIKPKRY